MTGITSESVTFHARVLLRQTSAELQRVGAVFYDAASAAWKEQQVRQQQRRRQRGDLPPRSAMHTNGYHSNHHPHAYLDEFGIPQADPLMVHNGDYTENGIEPHMHSPDRQQQANGDFIYLPNFRFRPANEGWASVANLDLFFQSLYAYYYNRGLVPIVSKGIVELVTLFFTLILSVFLFVYVDWSALAKCTDEHSCKSDFVQSYVRRRPLASWTLWNFMVILYCIIFCLYSMMAVLSFSHTIQQALNAKWVYEERLGISARKLLGGAVDWDRDVVSKLVALQKSGEYRVAIHNSGQDLDALVIANRILRKENFMIALFNRGLLDLTVPYISSPGDLFYCSTLEVSHCALSEADTAVVLVSHICTHLFVVRLCQWSIYFCALNFMFNHKYQIRPAFYLDPAALRRRFQLCGIAHVVLMPFLLFFVTIHFGLQNAYDWKSTKQYLGPREWSQPAKWSFREFNELQHLFERRLTPSYKAATAYLDLFGSNELVAAFGRILVFISGSLGAVVFAFAAINDAILLHVKIGDWNLLWYAGIFGVLYSGGKAMIPNASAQPKSARNLYGEIDEALTTVSTHTHYYPDTWKGRGWEQSTYKAFSSMFKYKVKLFATEVASLIVAPYILCFSLAKCAEPICEFILAIRAEIPGAGEVCGYATFDLEHFGDDRTLRSEEPLAGSLADSIMQTGNVEASIRQFPTPRARYGKMENSFLTFKVCFTYQ
jgi:autophagy-related protein 9